MAINASTNQYLNQIKTLRYIDVDAGPEGPSGVVSYWLVPANGYHDGTRFPHEVQEDLEAQDHKKTTLEGIEYFLVPEVSTNTPGRLSHYAQLTGEADLRNPPGGGVNRSRETFVDNSTAATVAPDTVREYVDSLDSHEEARKKKDEENARVFAQVHASVPAREPGDGKLTAVDAGNGPAPKEEAPKEVARPTPPASSAE